MNSLLFGIITPEQACNEVWDECENECNVFVQAVADRMRILLPIAGSADSITWWIENWPSIDPTTTMMRIDYIRAVTCALRGDFVIAGATAKEISNSCNSEGKKHQKTSHGHVAMVTGCDGGRAVGYSKSHGGTPHKNKPLSKQFPASILKELHYFAVLRGTIARPSTFINPQFSLPQW